VDPLRQAKDRAAELTMQGKLAAALEQWQRVVKATPNDLGARQKVADLLNRLGRKQEAIADYLDVVNRYAHGGQFFKAIALCKVILSLDPDHIAAQAYLADLYSRTRPPAPPKPSAPPPPMAPLELEGFEAVPAAPLLTASDDSDVIYDVEVVSEPEPPPPSMAGGDLPVIPLFSQLTREEFIAVLKSGMEVRSYSPGMPVVTEGEPGTGMFAVVQGTVAVLHEGRKVAQMAEGDFFGEMAMMSKSKRLATVTALSHVVALEFPRHDMEQLFSAHPGVAAALDAFYRERLLANLMRCSPLLAPLSEDEKVELSGRFEVKTFEPGHVILVQGQPGDGLYLIIRGAVSVIDRSMKRYPSLAEGDAFGEISVATGHAVTANVRAETQVVALRLPTDVVRSKVLTHPGVKPLLVGLIEERLARTRSMDLRV
jgi:cAMP-dependent protein kinase regulator